MPLDAIFLRALTNELSARASGMKIEKVQQPEKDLILLSLRGRGNSAKLLISLGSGSVRLGFTERSYENPQAPPMFCMLLRKHLTGALIQSVTQPGLERAVELQLEAYDELGEKSSKRLVAELFGRAPNLILADAEGRIVDCLRRLEGGLAEGRRQLAPGMFYVPPPAQEKPSFFESKLEGRRALWREASGEKTADRWLLDTFSGLSPLICRELCYRAFGDPSPIIGTLEFDTRERLADAMDALDETVSNREFLPCLLSEDETLLDFSFMAIRQYGDRVQTQVLPGFSVLLETFYAQKDAQAHMRRRSADLNKTVKTHLERAQRKLQSLSEELQRTGEREDLRKRGDLITANLYKLRRGMASFAAEDFYEPDAPELIIELDPLKTPAQNAARYYKEYNKAKTAERYLNEQIALCREKIDYLGSVAEAVGRAAGEKDLTAIRRELTETGYIKAPKGVKKEKNPKLEPPLRFVSSEGTEILVGRNNLQNDRLTFTLAARSDLWLHTQKVHGAHVLVRCAAGQEVGEETLAQAASLAVYFSKARGAGKTPVDYTQIRYVKKPAGALPGRVIYTDYKTILAQSDEALASKLQAGGALRPE